MALPSWFHKLPTDCVGHYNLFSMEWYKIVMRHSLLVYHGISKTATYKTWITQVHKGFWIACTIYMEGLACIFSSKSLYSACGIQKEFQNELMHC